LISLVFGGSGPLAVDGMLARWYARRTEGLLQA
jgi:hypothetical protein